MWLDDNVAEIDADAQGDVAVRRQALVPLGGTLLDFDGATEGLHDAGELRQQPVAGPLNQGPSVRVDCRFEHFAAQRGKARVCALLIAVHEAAEARDVDHHDRGQLSFWRRSVHSSRRATEMKNSVATTS